MPPDDHELPFVEKMTLSFESTNSRCTSVNQIIRLTEPIRKQSASSGVTTTSKPLSNKVLLASLLLYNVDRTALPLPPTTKLYPYDENDAM